VNADVYVFTSPSNAEAYLSKHKIDGKSTVIVFGESTKKLVKTFTDAAVLITVKPGEDGVRNLIVKLIQSG
jgi:uroporphyrinogen-III synthase